jgi:micrococcal nuclease
MKFAHIFYLIISFLVIGCNNHIQEINVDDLKQKEENGGFYNIKKFVDGDTFWIDDGSKKGLKIRLIGINTPESRPRFDNPAEYYGKEAAVYVKKLIGNTKVHLVTDVGITDRYGRKLAYIYLEDGTFLNYHLVRNGYASVMTVPPNVRFVDTLVMAQKLAQRDKLGIWGE